MNYTLTTVARWWQSKGFGIQSKTDFAFLHDVIREQLPYYAYASLHNAFSQATEKEMLSAQLLYRLCLHAKGHPITIVGTLTPVEELAYMLTKAHPMVTQELQHLHGIYLLIVKDIHSHNQVLWQEVLQAPCVSYDTRTLGIALFYPNRSPEHYHIL